MTDREDESRLRALGEALEKAKAHYARDENAGPTRGERDLSGMIRVVSELLGGIIVGTGLGYALDRATGWSPACMLIGFFLGAAGGMWTIYRTAMREYSKERK